MTLTRKEWENLVQKQRVRRTQAHRDYYQQVAQAEIPAKLLTQHPAWNWFLQTLGGLRQAAETALDAIDQQQRKSQDFSHEYLAKIQAMRLECAERIRTIDEMIALPSQMIDQAGQAKERLNELKSAESDEKPDLADAS